jgi:hypothetical protein
MTRACQASHRLRRWLRRHRLGSRSLATTLGVLLALGAAEVPAQASSAPVSPRGSSHANARWTAIWTDSGPLSDRGILDVVANNNLTADVPVAVDGQPRVLHFVGGGARLMLPAHATHRLTPPPGVQLVTINAASPPAVAGSSTFRLPSPPSAVSPSPPPIRSPSPASGTATASSAPGAPGSSPRPSGTLTPLVPAGTPSGGTRIPTPSGSPTGPVSPVPAISPASTPTPGSTPAAGSAARAQNDDRSRQQRWSFESALQGAQTVTGNLDKLEAGGEVILLVATGGACFVNVPRSEVLHCVGKILNERGNAGQTEEEKAAEGVLHEQNPTGTAASENAAQAASEARAELASQSGRPSISRTITGRVVAVEQPGYIQAYGYEYDRLTTTYQTRGLCVSITICSFTRYEIGPDGEAYVVGHVEKTSVSEVINTKPLGAPSADDAFAAAEGLGKAPGEADTSLEAARSLRLLAGTERVLRVGGNVVGVIGATVDFVEAGQAIQAGDTRAAIGDFAAGATLLAVLAVAEFVIPIFTDGVGLVLVLLAFAAVSWFGPDLAKGLAEGTYDQVGGHASNIESAPDLICAPDIYVTNATGSPASVQLNLRTAGAFDVSPPWNSGSWNVVAVPDGSLEADGARLSHLHYQLETVASWQRQTGWKISRQDFASWARQVLPAYGFSPPAVDGFVLAWAGLEQGSGDLDVYPQSRTLVDRLEPMQMQPSAASSRRVWFLFSPAAGASTPQPAQPQADPLAPIDVQEWGAVFDPGAYQAESPP